MYPLGCLKITASAPQFSAKMEELVKLIIRMKTSFSYLVRDFIPHIASLELIEYLTMF